MTADLDALGMGAMLLDEEVPSTGAEGQASDGGNGQAPEAIPFTEDDFSSLLDKKVVAAFRQDLAKLYQGVQGLVDRNTLQTQKRMDALEANLAIAVQYAEEMSDPERVTALKAQQAELRRERELAELRAERDALAARQNATPQEQRAADAEQSELQRWFETEGSEELQEYATEAGVALSDPAIAGRWPKAMPLREDGRVDRRGFLKQIKSLIDDAATAKERGERTSRPRATPDNTRPAGGGGSDADLLRRAAQPNVYLTPAELARVGELHAKAWG